MIKESLVATLYTLPKVWSKSGSLDTGWMNGPAFCVKPFHSASSYSGLLFCIIQSSFLPLQWPSEMKSRESVQNMHSKSLDDGVSFLPAKVFEYFFVLDPMNLNGLYLGPQSLAGVLGTGLHVALPVGTMERGCAGFGVSVWMERTFSPPCVSTHQNPSPPQSPATDRTALQGTLTCRHQDVTQKILRLGQIQSQLLHRVYGRVRDDEVKWNNFHVVSGLYAQLCYSLFRPTLITHTSTVNHFCALLVFLHTKIKYLEF